MFYDIDKLISEVAINVLALRYILDLSDESTDRMAQPFAIWFSKNIKNTKFRKTILQMLVGYEFESTKNITKLDALISQLTDKEDGIWVQSNPFKAVIPKLEKIAEGCGVHPTFLNKEKLSSYISKT